MIRAMKLSSLIPKKYRFIASLLVFLLATLVVIAEQPGKVLQQNDPGLNQVTEFVDGDTIVINMNGHSERVRMIGIDTPETRKPNSPIECYGKEASAYTKKRIGLDKVKLVADPLTTDRDRYNRLLRYVYLVDGTDLNNEIVKQGYGFYYPYFDFSRSNDYARAQQSAKKQNKGIWKACQPTQTDRGGWISTPL